MRVPSQSNDQHHDHRELQDHHNHGDPPAAFDHLYPVIKDPVHTHQVVANGDSVEMNSLGTYDSDVFEYGVDQKQEDAVSKASNGYGKVSNHDDSEMKYDEPRHVQPGSEDKHHHRIISQPGRRAEGKGQSGVNWIQKMVKDRRYLLFPLYIQYIFSWDNAFWGFLIFQNMKIYKVICISNEFGSYQLMMSRALKLLWLPCLN